MFLVCVSKLLIDSVCTPPFTVSLTLGFLTRNQLFIYSPSPRIHPLFSPGKRFLETRSVCDASNVERGRGEKRCKDRDDRLNRDEVETRKKEGRKKGRKEGKVGEMIHIFYRIGKGKVSTKGEHRLASNRRSFFFFFGISLE